MEFTRGIILLVVNNEGDCRKTVDGALRADEEETQGKGGWKHLEDRCLGSDTSKREVWKNVF